ncbi:uncharacterized protein CLUP02_07812 [Colletotrichum lupini]|uniref:Uncharacterized protein n=1 Tax=Colletotrichum lupini TaxID=145971 RepID=A0A9Q8WH18_9PEZI|nr:uncharacterized protein CLUP02_07812 [Colletotrichum lupini]UQC82325.1 hypothetical protein CLUP02_07812 [Colletotrichum lupini]
MAPLKAARLPCPQGGLLARAKTPRHERRETAFCPSWRGVDGEGELPKMRVGSGRSVQASGRRIDGRVRVVSFGARGDERDREASFTNISVALLLINNASRWPHLIVGKAFASDKGLLVAFASFRSVEKISNKPPLRWVGSLDSNFETAVACLPHRPEIEDGPVSDAVAFVAGNDPYGLFALGPFLMTITKIRILPAMRLTDVLRAYIFQVQTLSMSDKSLPQAGIFPPATIARPHHARDAAQTPGDEQRNDRDRSRPLLSCKDFTGTDAFQLMRWRGWHFDGPGGPSFPLPNPSLSARLGKKAMTSSYVLLSFAGSRTGEGLH